MRVRNPFRPVLSIPRRAKSGPRHPLAGRTLAALAIVAALVGVAPMATAEVFDLHLRSFCSPGSHCGSLTDEAYEAKLLDTVALMNKQWSIVGFSFRPIIYPIDTSNPEAYNITGCKKDNPANPFACTNDETIDCTSNTPCLPGGGTCKPLKVCEDLSTRCREDADCSAIGGACHPRNAQQRILLAQEYSIPERDAITMFLFEQPNTCCSNPPGPNDPDESISAIYCDGNRSVLENASGWTHEMGHYWCLRHTFSNWDWINSGSEPNHDGDGLPDTPPDPNEPEPGDGIGRCTGNTSIVCSDDSQCTGAGVCQDVWTSGSDFCLIDSPLIGTDDGSLFTTRCTTTCKRCLGGECGLSGGGVLVNTGYDPYEHNALSYYGHKCRAPYSVGGIGFVAFTPDQWAEVATCRTTWQRRIDLPEVCGAHGGDADHDGICQNDDNCPEVSNTAQKDLDGDGVGDRCDLCWMDPTPETVDTDGDGVGDLCDPDRDDDGCDNNEDQDPDNPTQVIGVTHVEGPCDGGQYDTIGDAGENSDNDEVPNCWDVDDDNDGICDENESWPPNEERGTPQGCSPGPDPCPTVPGSVCVNFEVGAECIEPWLACFGGDCNELYALWESVVNPDPTTTLRFDNIQLQPRRLFATAPASMTPASAALQMAGQAQALRGPGEQFRLTLWQEGGTEPLAVLIDSYSPSEVELGEFQAGEMIVLEEWINPDVGGREIRIRTQYGISATNGGNDDDLIPSFADNCRDLYNPDQRDTDGDGFGDACDGDVDNDGVVTQLDYDLINSCDGVDVSQEIVFSEPADYDLNGPEDPGLERESTDPAVAAEILRCAPYDLTGDGLVDYRDRNVVEGSIGQMPGPAGRINRPPVADAGPDRGIGCDASFALDASGSTDPDGHTLRCQWSSESCAIVNADSCTDASANCSGGGLHTVQLIVDDGTATATDEFVADATHCAPGSIGETLRVDKGPNGTLLLDWLPVCGTNGQTRYAIYEGNLDDPASLAPRGCGYLNRPLAYQTVHDDAFFLLVPNRGTLEGSFGKDGNGVERPLPENRCRGQQALTVCPN